MGPYLYYDTPFLEDANTGFHIHDCMWSGECCTCQPAARLTFTSSHHCELQAVVVQQVVDKLDPASSPSPSSSACSSLAKAPSRGPTKAQIQAAMAVAQQPQISTVVQSAAGSTPAAIQIRALTQSPKSPQLASSVASSSTASIAQSSSTTIATATSRQTHRSANPRKVALSTSKGNGSANHKKLRHREVEKNRHRQLQAMVKTLSEKIPGRLDKETQVQTMKRAARYCLYLRDVLNLVLAYTKAAANSGADSNPEAASLALKDKLESLYMRSCDNVELIMAQHMTTR